MTPWVHIRMTETPCYNFCNLQFIINYPEFIYCTSLNFCFKFGKDEATLMTVAFVPLTFNHTVIAQIFDCITQILLSL